MPTLINNQRQRQIAIFDPVCGMEFGHNLQAAIQFATYFQDNLNCTTSIYLALKSIYTTSYMRHTFLSIPWIYEYYISTTNVSFLCHFQRFVKFLTTRFSNFILVRILICCLQFLNHQLCVYLITSSVRRVLLTHVDILFIPGLDIYTLIALANLSQSDQVPAHKRIVVRLMGIMENAGYFPDSHNVCLLLLRKLLASIPNIYITAETEAYANYLQKQLHIQVPVTHIPNDFLSRKEDINDTFFLSLLQPIPTHSVKLLCPGAARDDKGYFDLFKVATLLHNRYRLKLHLIFQSMSPQHPTYNSDYEQQLSSLPNITRLPPYLSSSQLRHVNDITDVIFLPYDEQTYEYRGSASLFDALGMGKIFIGKSGTGFGLTINSCGLGFTYSSERELQQVIDALLNLDAPTKQLIDENQSLYISKMKSFLDEAINGQTNMRFY